MAVEFPRGAALMLRVYFIKAIRQIDERYGQFGSDADLAARDPARVAKDSADSGGARAARGPHAVFGAWSDADFLNCRAVFLGKYQGFGAGLQARVAACLGPLAALRLGELKYTISGQKIDGTQE